MCRETTVLRGDIGHIDLAAHRLVVNPGNLDSETVIEFRHLVLTLGGIVDLSRVPGMAEHAFLMKNVGDALQLRAGIIDRFEEANLETDPVCQRRMMTFVVVGGGYSGVETAGQILDLGKEMIQSYPRIPSEFLKIVLIHSGATLLPQINEALGKYCEENLRARGVEIILNARVTAMTARKVMLSDGRTIDSSLVVSTVGNAPHPILSQLCRDSAVECVKGRIITDSRLRVPGHENLWAAGDCAAVPMPVQGSREEAHARPSQPDSESAAPSPFQQQTYCPPTAQFALRQGKLLAQNLAAMLGAGDQLRDFRFTGLGELAAIGHHAAVAEVFGMRFQGFFAWWLWRSVYLMKLPGLERKLRVVMEWTLDLFFPRDIALFQPKPTHLMQEMHLEKDDIVFEAGEPARSLYVVKSGTVELHDDRGATLRTLKAGEQLGKQTILGKHKWRFTAVATEPTTLVAVSSEVFETVASTGASPEAVFSRPEPTVVHEVHAKEKVEATTPLAS
ncbi:MAG: FAD-dependent oxidoreductase, partial [Chthoniobacteraceae bacterium]